MSNYDDWSKWIKQTRVTNVLITRENLSKNFRSEYHPHEYKKATILNKSRTTGIPN